MRRYPKTFLVLGLMAVLVLVFYAQQKDQSIDQAKQTQTATVKPATSSSRLPCEGYDLASYVDDIVTGSGATGPYVRVTGRIKNIGTQDFVCAAGKAEARLCVIVFPNAECPPLKSVGITRLNRGQSISIFDTYHLSSPPGFEWCGWGCVPLRGGICTYLRPIVTVQYWDEAVRNADCRPENNSSADRPEHRIHFIKRCTE